MIKQGSFQYHFFDIQGAGFIQTPGVLIDSSGSRREITLDDNGLSKFLLHISASNSRQLHHCQTFSRLIVAAYFSKSSKFAIKMHSDTLSSVPNRTDEVL